MEEEWRKIEGTLNHYISNMGNVKNFATNNVLKQQNRQGYCYVSLRLHGRKLVCKQVHRLVGQEFIPNFENLPQIHHIDNNPSNNNVSNLRWVTNIENAQAKNKNINIGYISSYFKNDIEYYVAGLTNYGKRYQKYSKNREICEEWLIKRRYEINNSLEILSTDTN